MACTSETELMPGCVSSDHSLRNGQEVMCFPARISGVWTRELASASSSPLLSRNYIAAGMVWLEFCWIGCSVSIIISPWYLYFVPNLLQCAQATSPYSIFILIFRFTFYNGMISTTREQNTTAKTHNASRDLNMSFNGTVLPKFWSTLPNPHFDMERKQNHPSSVGKVPRPGFQCSIPQFFTLSISSPYQPKPDSLNRIVTQIPPQLIQSLICRVS